MTSPDGRQPVDSSDHIVLRQVRDLWAAVDPPPAHLVDWVQFALEPTTPEAEILKATGHREPVAARGDEHTRSITFDGESLTVIVTLTPTSDDMVRVDGWITPADTLPVELRTARGVLSSAADERGRFAFGQVCCGPVQLVIRHNGTTLTPSIVV
jgi:hypothetical protein